MTAPPITMSTDAWENVARCAWLRMIHLRRGGLPWWDEWSTWQAALMLGRRCPF